MARHPSPARDATTAPAPQRLARPPGCLTPRQLAGPRWLRPPDVLADRWRLVTPCCRRVTTRPDAPPITTNPRGDPMRPKHLAAPYRSTPGPQLRTPHHDHPYDLRRTEPHRPARQPRLPRSDRPRAAAAPP